MEQTSLSRLEAWPALRGLRGKVHFSVLSSRLFYSVLTNSSLASSAESTLKETTMNQIRWSTMNFNSIHSPSYVGGNQTQEMLNGAGSAPIDEFVLDQSRGTLTTLETPPSFLNLLNANASYDLPSLNSLNN